MLLNRKARTATGALALLCTLALAACSQSGDGGGATPQGGEGAEPTIAVYDKAQALVPEKIAKEGVLTVAIPTNEPPTQFYREGTKTMTGINPDVARLVAGTLGLKLQIEVTNFDSIIPGIEAGRYQATVSSMTPTEERIKALDFVDYLNMGSGLAVRNGNPQKLDFDSLCGKKVAVLTGSYQLKVYVPDLNAACKKAGKGELEIQQFQDTRQAISSLVSDRSDAVYADGPILSFAAKQNPDIEVPDNNTASPVSIGLSKDAGLTDAVKVAMEHIITTPEYTKVLESYGVESMAIKTVNVNVPQ
ncbi:ABC transporter substrate-binding protein [Leucobacter edaphi]|nr:ABC transporter substrate-binding protein [Leucobacter edaphi]